MPRLFVSHSSKDNIQALAFQRWLMAKGWSKDDIFIDLHDMRAGEKWRETLVKANIACEALLFLASPDALASEECLREVRRAEDDRKDVIVAILRGVSVDDPGLAGYADRQIMDLSTNPREERVEVEHNGQRHLIDFNRATLNAIHAKLIDWGIAPDAFAWPPRHNPGAPPYPGLDALDEHSTGIFFGREADVMAGIRELRQIRHRGSPRLLVVQAASGAGKSSFLRAGLWPRLGRAAEFVPLAVVRPASGIITGQQGLGQGVSRWFGERRRQVAPGTIHSELMAGDPAAGAEKLAAQMSAAVALEMEERALGLAGGQAPPRLSPLLAIDQAEELFAAEDTVQSNRFLEMMGHLLGSPPAGLDPYVLVTIRADSVDALLQRVATLGLETPHTIVLLPLSPAAYRDVITKPAAVYTRHVARLDLEPQLVEALVKGASGADALPLLAFTLQRLFLDYAPEQTLTMAHYDAMGGIEGSIDRKLAEAKTKAGGVGTDADLRRLIVPALATWDDQANAAKRLLPQEREVVGGHRAGLAPLANALVEARLLTRGAGTLEVAHEALLRRQPIAGWLDEEKDALKLRDDILREAKEWVDGGEHDEGLVRRGARLQSAFDLLDREDFNSVLAPANDYLLANRRLETLARRKALAQVLGILLVLGVAGIVAFIYQEFLSDRYRVARKFLWEQYHWRVVMRPLVLFAEQEKAAAKVPNSKFAECAVGCPDMVVVPAGEFAIRLRTAERVERKYEDDTPDDDDQPAPRNLPSADGGQQTVAKSSPANDGGESATAKNPSADDSGAPPVANSLSVDASGNTCKADLITVSGRARSTKDRERELRGDGAAMRNAIAKWEQQARDAFGEQWKKWSSAKDTSFDCQATKGGQNLGAVIGCTVSGRPCEGLPANKQPEAKPAVSPITVTMAKPLAVSKTTVTFAQWDMCVAAGGCPKISDNGWGRGDRPVILITWQEAKGYVGWLTRMTGKEYRLLTEAEWEYAARAGNEQPYSLAEDHSKLGDYAWFYMNSQDKTEPVGKKKANDFGLHDVHGNVWQWVEDCVHDRHADAPEDGSSASTGACTTDDRRVVRGGSWHMDPLDPSADRSAVSPDLRSVTLGFRAARVLNTD